MKEVFLKNTGEKTWPHSENFTELKYLCTCQMSMGAKRPLKGYVVPYRYVKSNEIETKTAGKPNGERRGDAPGCKASEQANDVV